EAESPVALDRGGSEFRLVDRCIRSEIRELEKFRGNGAPEIPALGEQRFASGDEVVYLNLRFDALENDLKDQGFSHRQDLGQDALFDRACPDCVNEGAIHFDRIDVEIVQAGEA